VKELARYLIKNIYLDFQGEINFETIQGFLKKDQSLEAKALLSKITEDGEIDEFLITLADCLLDYLSSGITEKVVHEQLVLYSEA
jgi:hypothetical protein